MSLVVITSPRSNQYSGFHHYRLVLPDLELCINRILQIALLCACLLLLIIMSMKFIHILIVCGSGSFFLLMNIISLNEYTTISLSVPHLMNIGIIFRLVLFTYFNSSIGANWYLRGVSTFISSITVGV